MTNAVSKYPDQVLDVTMDWNPALAAGDSLALVDGEPDVTATAVEPGSGVVILPVASIVETVDGVTRIRLGPDEIPGRGSIALLARTAGGEKPAENIEVTVKARF